MSERGTRFAVVVVDKNFGDRYLQYLPKPIYVAKIVSNTESGQMTESGREWIFGKTVNEIEFWEADSHQEALLVATVFNRYSAMGLYQSPSRIGRAFKEQRSREEIAR